MPKLYSLSNASPRKPLRALGEVDTNIRNLSELYRMLHDSRNCAWLKLWCNVVCEAWHQLARKKSCSAHHALVECSVYPQ